MLAEIAEKDIDATSVLTVVEAKLPPKALGNSHESSNRRSPRLIPQGDTAAEEGEHIPPEVKDYLAREVEDKDVCNASTAGKIGRRTTNPMTPICEKCRATFKSLELATRYKNKQGRERLNVLLRTTG